MVTQQERARLMEEYKDRPLHAAALVINCALCLFFISGVALIGGQSELRYDGARMQAHQVHAQSLTTASIDCQDAATTASGQAPEKIKTASAAVAETSRKRHVSLPLVGVKGC